jgi:hypothetical protein
MTYLASKLSEHLNTNVHVTIGYCGYKYTKHDLVLERVYLIAEFRELFRNKLNQYNHSQCY